MLLSLVSGGLVLPQLGGWHGSIPCPECRGETPSLSFLGLLPCPHATGWALCVPWQSCLCNSLSFPVPGPMSVPTLPTGVPASSCLFGLCLSKAGWGGVVVKSSNS